MIVSTAVPYLLRTAHDVPRLCESLGYSGQHPPVELRTEHGAPHFGRRRSDRSLRQVVSEPAERTQTILEPIDRPVERAETLVVDRDCAEVDDAHERLGRLLSASIEFAMVPARVRS